MLKKISAQKARQRFGELMDEVRLRGDRLLNNSNLRNEISIIPCLPPGIKVVILYTVMRGPWQLPALFK